jgi:hypothetical protein
MLLPKQHDGERRVRMPSVIPGDRPPQDTPCDQAVDHRLGRRVISESTADSAGHDALRITIVLIESGSADRITGDKAVDALIRTHTALRQANEERLPIVEYATEEELEASDDTES